MIDSKDIDSLEWFPLSKILGWRVLRVGIYLIRVCSSKRMYVGSSSDIFQRICEHRSALANGRHPNRKMGLAHDRHGLSGMEWAILMDVTSQNLLDEETKAIVKFDAFRNGLNETPSGSGAGRIPSDETRRKISEKGRGKIVSQETRTKLSIASKNISAESRKSASLKKLGRRRDRWAVLRTSLANTGSKRSTESKIKISKSLSKITVEQGYEIQSLYLAGLSYLEIAQRFGVNKQTICNVISRKNKFLNANLPEIDRNLRNKAIASERRRLAQIGKILSESTRKIMSFRRRGVPKSSEHRTAIQRAHILRYKKLKEVKILQ